MDDIRDKRPEWVHCIDRERSPGLTWCGKRRVGWCFVDIDHATENGAKEGRLVACAECVEAITKALGNGAPYPADDIENRC
jgi:hypothetical protein